MKFVFRLPSRLFVLVFLFMSSCLKNSDETARGPKSDIVVSNFVVTGNALDAWWDNDKLNANPLEFGSATGSPGSLYTAVGSGLHSIRLSSGNISVYNKNFSFEAGVKYSLFTYDSLQNEAVKVLLLKDDTATIDTLARMRFLQFIPGPDTLSLVLVNTNTGFRVTGSYIESKTLTGSENEFSLLLPPADYSMILQRKNVTIAELPSFDARARKIYTIVSKGIVNGTGTYQQGIEVIQHN